MDPLIFSWRGIVDEGPYSFEKGIDLLIQF